MAQIRGTLEELLADPRLAVHERVQATLTDDSRPVQAMDRLRGRFPHTLVLGFEPATGTGPRCPGPGRRAAPTTTSPSTSSPTCGARLPRRRRRGLLRAVDACCEDPDFDVLVPRRTVAGELHHLEITAFGPFADTVAVDFDHLSDAGLFLLSGATAPARPASWTPSASRCTATCRATATPPSGCAPTRRLRAPPLRDAGGDALGTPLPDRPLARVGAAQEARHGHHLQQASVTISERTAGAWQPLSSRLDETGTWWPDWSA